MQNDPIIQTIEEKSENINKNIEQIAENLQEIRKQIDLPSQGSVNKSILNLPKQIAHGIQDIKHQGAKQNESQTKIIGQIDTLANNQEAAIDDLKEQVLAIGASLKNMVKEAEQLQQPTSDESRRQGPQTSTISSNGLEGRASDMIEDGSRSNTVPQTIVIKAGNLVSDSDMDMVEDEGPRQQHKESTASLMPGDAGQPKEFDSKQSFVKQITEGRNNNQTQGQQRSV